MLIAGAGGHAKDILASISENQYDEIYFFDDISLPKKVTFSGGYKILSSTDEAATLFKKNKQFIIGIGEPKLRKTIHDKLNEAGGIADNFISNSSIIGKFDVVLSTGLNIMPGVFISNNVTIKDGTLINTLSSIHHGVVIGRFCEISPGCRILGDVKIGNFTTIGANATIFPNIEIGNHVVIGAGAVVTKNIPDNATAVGIPAKVIKIEG